MKQISINRSMVLIAGVLAVAALSAYAQVASADPAPTVPSPALPLSGTKLSRTLDLKAQIEALRQEKALQHEMGEGQDVELPAVVLITGREGRLSARIRLTGGAVRTMVEGDALGRGWVIQEIRTDAVLAVLPSVKGKPQKRVSLAFVQRSLDGGFQRPAGPFGGAMPMPEPLLRNVNPVTSSNAPATSGVAASVHVPSGGAAPVAPSAGAGQ